MENKLTEKDLFKLIDFNNDLEMEVTFKAIDQLGEGFDLDDLIEEIGNPTEPIKASGRFHKAISAYESVRNQLMQIQVTSNRIDKEGGDL